MLHTILAFGVHLGVGLMVLGLLLARVILEVSGTPESVMGEALVYIRIYLLSIPFMSVYNFGAAILRSYGDTRRPMYYLIVSGTVNVILNLVFVIGFGMGVSGVAIATWISNIISTIMVLYHLAKRQDEFHLDRKQLKINKKALKKVLQIGIPAGIQGAIFSISNVFIQSGINSFGEDAIAGSSLALNFEYFTYDIANAFAQAAVTFTSQNYGAANFKRCRKTFWLCMAFGIGFTEILSIVFMIWDDFCQYLHDFTGSGGVRAHPDAPCLFAGRTDRHLRGGKCRTARYGKIPGTGSVYHSGNCGVPPDLAVYSI